MVEKTDKPESQQTADPATEQTAGPLETLDQILAGEKSVQQDVKAPARPKKEAKAQEEDLEKLYAESSKEAKRLYALNKEQEARMNALAEESARVKKAVEYYEPFINALNTNPEFVKHVAGFVMGDKTEQKQDYGLGEDFENFNPKDLSNPNTPSGKYIRDVIAGTASQLVESRLSEFSKRTQAEKQADSNRMRVEREIDEFATANKVSRDEVLQALEEAKKRPMTIADVWGIVNKDKTTQKVDSEARKDVLGQMKTVQSMPRTLATKPSGSSGQSLQDKIFEELKSSIDQSNFLSKSD